MVCWSTSGECGKPFDVKVIAMVQIHFFSAFFFPSYHDSATLMVGMELWAHFTLPDLVILATSFVVSQLSFVVFCKP